MPHNFARDRYAPCRTGSGSLNRAPPGIRSIARLARSVPVPRLTWPGRRSQPFSSGHQLPFTENRWCSLKYLLSFWIWGIVRKYGVVTPGGQGTGWLASPPPAPIRRPSVLDAARSLALTTRKPDRRPHLRWGGCPGHQLKVLSCFFQTFRVQHCRRGRVTKCPSDGLSFGASHPIQ